MAFKVLQHRTRDWRWSLRARFCVVCALIRVKSQEKEGNLAGKDLLRECVAIKVFLKTWDITLQLRTHIGATQAAECYHWSLSSACNTVGVWASRSAGLLDSELGSCGAAPHPPPRQCRTESCRAAEILTPLTPLKEKRSVACIGMRRGQHFSSRDCAQKRFIACISD